MSDEERKRKLRGAWLLAAFVACMPFQALLCYLAVGFREEDYWVHLALALGWFVLVFGVINRLRAYWPQGNNPDTKSLDDTGRQ